MLTDFNRVMVYVTQVLDAAHGHLVGLLISIQHFNFISFCPLNSFVLFFLLLIHTIYILVLGYFNTLLFTTQLHVWTVTL